MTSVIVLEGDIATDATEKSLDVVNKNTVFHVILIVTKYIALHRLQQLYTLMLVFK